MVDSLPSQLSVPAISDKMVCSVLKRRMQWAFQEEFIRAEYILRGSHWGYSFTQHFTQSQSLPVLSVPADVLRPLPPSSLLWFLRTLREQFPRLSKISKCVSWIVKNAESITETVWES